MSTVLHPVGPRRARVYWVRRLLAVVVVVALAVLATTAVSWLRGGREDAAAAAGTQAPGEVGAAAVSDQSGGSDADAGDAGDDAAGGEAEADGQAEAGAAEEEPASSTPVACTPEALQLTLTSAEVEFAPATNPVLTATVTNVGDLPCTVDAGEATREVVVTSGEDRVWSTKDCATEESASRQLLLGAGAVDSVPVEWPRVRSADGCPADLPAPEPGSYQAVATLGATTSQTVVFILR